MTIKIQEINNDQENTAEEKCDMSSTCVVEAIHSKDKSGFIQEKRTYNFPPMELLDKSMAVEDNDGDYRAKVAQAITRQMAVFGIRIKIADTTFDSTVTRYEFDVLSPHTRMNEFIRFSEDISACAKTHDGVRVVAPVRGSRRVGVEVANRVKRPVLLRDVLESDIFQKSEGKLVFAVGQGINGAMITADLANVPHILITGMAGAGKSMALNSLIVSLIYRYSPKYVRFVMVDPKFVELSRYNGMPHMLTEETITSNGDALAAMDYLIDEMESRYMLFRQKGLRNICEYNDSLGSDAKRLPYLVFIVDELSDLMSANKHAFESKLVRLAQRSRAAGIHMVLATQRFDDKTICGAIKANMPFRMTFKVLSAFDSMTVTGSGGAEKLIGKGDMLFATLLSTELLRIQGAYVSSEEICKAVKYLRANNEAYYDYKIAKKIFISRKKTSADGTILNESYEQYIKFDLKADGKGYRVSAYNARTPTKIAIPTRYRNLLVAKISERGFADCRELVSVTIPKYVKNIGEEAFANCDNLTTVNMSISVSNIQDLAFFGCDNLKDVYYGGTQEQWQKIQIGSGNDCIYKAIVHFKK